MRVLSRQSITRFFQLEANEWIDLNMTGEFKMAIDGVEGRILFATVCWSLRKARNNFVFQHVYGDVDVDAVLQWATWLILVV